ncbi:MAG: 30S ribosomal protein S12 methylthiotransferase RimO [Acidimicrobiales bacterium]|nr:30S ribosomal protein S12 methylthiotransferase RimO [Acidimicrobiaceae bacterium]MDP6078266.1 30S ribosomal protein S12 methylthiotransferase RimO [Acidimicrobiales bacterium]MDP7257838.1 30S ribosomal protein S12 methylthiotransferase RimO [Acidimicrobiales bacterium]HCV35970.1 30S ribosomal protein S12 methylthiotransferase RimO [Acidimicrobiaceae bacterium]HJO78964.1 30S ribosomal protein S12 methylthiotransferase RimO [Acidimicrobiales bacterium]|tara:strand:- start:2352 stop:3596 length:1245 start_codon:yes stop_codon:yes gene_type:complete
MSEKRYHLVTLGCPKNQVDSDKLAGTLVADGMVESDVPDDADLIVVNTCAFIEEARQESIDTVLALADVRRDGARLVVTGCMAERYGDELAGTLPEADSVSGFGIPVTLGRRVSAGPMPMLDLLNLPRPSSPRPWAYVKVAEGCDRSCGFCAIPTFRGPQRSRPVSSILDEVDALGVREVVLVAQDLASFGLDQGTGERAIIPLIEATADRVDRVRLLYLYPSDLTDGLVEAVLATGVPYFDLSLQHVSRRLLRNMRRWGDGRRFRERIDYIRNLDATATFRSNFIVGYPGETEEDHDELLAFVENARLDWCGFFAFSEEAGTHAVGLSDKVSPGLVAERLRELSELQDAITAKRRDALIGGELVVLVDEPGVGRTHREAPEIDGVVHVSRELPVGEFATVLATGALGPDLEAT